MSAKKVLVIAYNFPPIGGSGVQRSAKFVKYLSHFGWEPIVLTVEKHMSVIFDETLQKEIPESTKIIRTHHYDLTERYLQQERSKQSEVSELNQLDSNEPKTHYFQKIMSIIKTPLRWFVTVPDRKVGWLPWAFPAALKAIHRDKISLIYISGDPFSSFLLGPLLKLFTGKPYLIDFRDEWCEFLIQPGGVIQNMSTARVKIELCLESFVIRFASQVISVTDSIIENFRHRYPKYSKDKFVCITNGYDGEAFHKADQLPEKTDRLTISYVGAVNRLTAVKPFLEALKQLIAEDPQFENRLRIRFVGKIWDSIEPAFSEYAFKCLEFTGYLSHPKCVNYLRQSDVLLILLKCCAGMERVLTGKVFDYMAVKKPILAITPKGELQNFIETHQLGISVSPDEINAIKHSLKQLVQQYQEFGNCQRLLGNADLSQFDRKVLTSQLAHLFDHTLL